MTSPSAGVPSALRPRLEVALAHLRTEGYDIVVGECMDGDGVVSAPAPARAAELMAMLTDPDIAAVVPPWGGELAADLLVHLDWGTIAAAEPTWLVGYSDVSTLMLPLLTLSTTASLHAPNLMEAPDPVPAPLASWLDVLAAPPRASITQGASSRHRAPGFDDWAGDPSSTHRRHDVPGSWELLDPDVPVHVRGRLVGGCLETMAVLAGTRYGDVAGFAAAHADEGLLVYVEAAEHHAFDVARDLWRLRLSGWFDAANAVLVGRTGAADSPGLSQRDAVARVLGDLGVPVVLDVDCGHVPPQLTLVNGAVAELVVDGDTRRLTQHLT